MKSSTYNKKQVTVSPPTFPDEKPAPKGVHLLVSIVDRGKGEGVVRLLKRHGSHFHTILLGRGTARKALLDYLALGETEKDIVFSGISAENAATVLKYLIHALQFDAPGRGIAFTLPINSVSGNRALPYLAGNSSPGITGGDKKEELAVKSFEYSLILSIVNRGFTDLVVDAATEKGARGGTILHARGAGLEDAGEFFGITIVPEKEIVMILVKNQDKNAIMQAIIASSGLSTPAHGVSFSLPVDQAVGMARMLTEDFDNE